MSINIEDREFPHHTHHTVIRKRPTPEGGWTFHWQCPKCPFVRSWTTESGAIEKVARHLLQEHRMRLTLEKKE